MAHCYFELRTHRASGIDNIAADIMRHLHARQHLGKVIIVCDQPFALLTAGRLQWVKLIRMIQRQRSNTLNTDKILKYTYTATHMQRMRFTHKSPLENPDADVYFLDSRLCEVLPTQCYTLYIHTLPGGDAITPIIKQLPIEALIVDYEHRSTWEDLGMRPKYILEQRAENQWRQMKQFMRTRGINVTELISNGIHDTEAMDDALDTLLAASNRFLRAANEFQRALELARPLKTDPHTREEYDTLVLLAYRVQALSPGTFTQRFLESYNEDDTFLLHDVAKENFMASGEPLKDAVARHHAAGRRHLAQSLGYVFAKAHEV